MSSQRSPLLLLDAASANCLSLTRGNIYASTAAPRAYGRTSLRNMALFDDTSISYTEPRMPSFRPINQRWDRSRGILTGGGQRNVLRDFRWSSNQPINLSDTPACKREYATRDLFGDSRKAKPQSSQLNQRNEDQLVQNPYQISARSIDRGEAMRQQTQAEIDRLKRDNKKKDEDLIAQKAKMAKMAKMAQEISTLRLEIAKPSIELKAQDDALKDRAADLKVIENELKQKEAGINAMIRSRQQEMDQQSQKREAKIAADLQAREDSLKAKEDNYNITVEEAWSEARREANKEVEDVLASALDKESDATGRLKAVTHSQQKLEDLMKRTAEEAEQERQRAATAMVQRKEAELKELQQYKDTLEKDLVSRLGEEMRVARKAGEDRAAFGRYDYEAYHAVWDELMERSAGLLFQITMIYQQLYRRVDRARAIRGFDGYAIHSSFSQKYPTLNDTLKKYVNSAFHEAQASALAMKDRNSDLGEARSTLRWYAHVSRQLTRYHRFDEMQRNQDMVTLTRQMLDEHPLRQQRENIEKGIRRLELRWKETSSENDRKAIESELRQSERERQTISKWMGYYIAFRQCEAMKELKADSVFEKEVWKMTRPAHEDFLHADELWNNFKRANPRTIAESEVSERQQTQDRQDFLDKHRATRQQIRDFEEFVRKRQLLQLHLGEVKEDDGRFDDEIQQEIVKAELKIERELRIATVTRRGSETSFVPAPTRASVFNTTATPAKKTTASQQSTFSLQDKRERRAIHALEERATSLRKKLKQPNANADEPAKEKDERELDEVMLKYHRAVIARTNKRLEADPSAKPGILARLKKGLKVQEEKIAALRVKLKSNAEAKSKSDASESEAADVPRVATHREKRLIRRMHSIQPIPTMELSRKTASTMHFIPTAARHARHSSSSERFRWFHTDGSQVRLSERLDESMSSDEMDHSFRDASALSHAFQPREVPSSSSHGNDQRQQTQSSREASSAKSQGSTSMNQSETNEQEASGQANAEPPSDSSDQESDDTAYYPSDSEGSTSTKSSDEFEDAVETMHLTETGEANGTTTDLTYNISAEDYRKAVLASKNTNAAFWTYKLYKNPEGRSPTVHYCVNYELTEAWAKHFLEEPVLGFDLEWEYGATPEKLSIKNSVSLIQISSESKIALFHVALFKGETSEQLMPPSLRAICESPDIAKAGVNISGDAVRMKKCFGIQMKGLFELSHLYNVVTYAERQPEKVNRKLLKMADQVQNILLLPLKKGDVRTSAWSKKLRMDQTEYAASDAYAGFRLYHALEAKRKKMHPMPPRPAFWEEHKPLILGDGTRVVAKKYAPKRKRQDLDGMVEEEDDECQEYFDAVESPDLYQIDSKQTGGVPLSGIDVTYPTLPSLDPDQESRVVAARQPSETNKASSATEPASSTSKPPPPTKRSQPPISSEVTHADTWAQTWRASLPAEYKLKVGNASLRAYHLWHEQRFDCKEVAALLRDPPLSVQTVASYVMQALNEENLAYDAQRVSEPLGILPKSVHGRYWRIVEKVEQ